MPAEYKPVIVMLRAGLAGIVILRALLYSAPAGDQREPATLIASLVLGAGIALGVYVFWFASVGRRGALWGSAFELVALFVLEMLYIPDMSTHFYTLNIIVLIEVAMIAGMVMSVAYWMVGAGGYVLALVVGGGRNPLDPDLGEQSLQLLFGLFVAVAAGVLAQRLQKAVLAERDARLRLGRSERAKSQLMKLMSHDLRNPLAVVTSYAHLLGRGERRLDDEQTAKAVTEIERGARQLDERLEELLEIDSAFGGERDVRPQAVSVSALLESVVTDAAVTGRREVLVDCPDELVMVDVGTTRHLVKLLLRSAVSHIATDRSVTLHGRLEGDRLIISVSPSWVGSAVEGGRGTLDLVQVLAEDLGGSLRIEQGPSGTIVELSIPSTGVSKTGV